MKHLKRTHLFHNARLEYYLSNPSPKILMVSGIHGDEYGIIKSVIKTLEKHFTKLPGFLYIPHACPSAIAQKTRHNNEGRDVNRHFVESSNVDEAIAVQQLVRNLSFETCITFHEDTKLTEFYLYDTENNPKNPVWVSFKEDLKYLDVPLHTGIDDHEDALLQNHIIEGYGTIPKEKHTIHFGFLETWIIGAHIAKRALILEIPSSLPQKMKDKIVKKFVEHFVL